MMSCSISRCFDSSFATARPLSRVASFSRRECLNAAGAVTPIFQRRGAEATAHSLRLEETGIEVEVVRRGNGVWVRKAGEDIVCVLGDCKRLLLVD